MDFDISKTSWTKLRHILNKPFWHISDFVLASYTFGCVKMSDFAPNNRHLREVLIFFFRTRKTVAKAHRELQKKFTEMLWNNMPWLVPSLQTQWFRYWRPSAWRKAKNLRRRWCYLFWTIETHRNHHWGTVLNEIDAFEPSTARKTATIL